MTYVVFAVGEHRLGLPADVVIEVVPAPPLQPLDGTPAWVAGVFTHFGQIVPVVDLCRLHAGRPSRRAFSTRIMVVRYPVDSGKRPALGLLGEGVTEACAIADGRWQPSGVATPDAPWLGPLAPMPDGTFLQKVTLTDLLPADVRQRLFP